MNNRMWIGVGIVLAVLVGAGVIAAKASRGTGSSDAVSLRGKATADEKLLSDIRQYREQAATLAPDQAAERWFQLYDRAASLDESGFDGDFASLDHAIGDMVGVRSSLAALPPPAAWRDFRRLATQRAAEDPDERATLGLKFLGELLDGDRAAATGTLGALEKAGADTELVVGTHSLLARLYGDEETRVGAFQQELRAANRASQIRIPDLHPMVGEQRAAALLTEAMASPGFLRIEGGTVTRALARRIALANLERMKRPQWDLAADIDGAPLYEALVAKFSAASPQSSDTDAAIYYFLRMVSDGRQADAKEALQTVIGREELSIPRAAVDALTAAQLNEPLFRFLHAQLARRPALRAWDVYLEQAAFTGHSREALRLIDGVLARKDLDAGLLADMRERRTAALLAADDVDAAAAELLVRFAKPPTAVRPDLGQQVKAAIDAAAIGRLTGRKNLANTGIAFARAALLLPQGEDTDYELMFAAPRLYAELRKQQREPEALQTIEARLARQKSAAGDDEGSNAEQEYFDVISSVDHRPGLVEMAAIHSAAGRHAQVLELLANSEDWGAVDLAELLIENDSLQVPLGAIVARALRASGDEAAALRVASATVAAQPGNDAAYEIIASLDKNAAQTLEARFALDQYEERPLIWKASHELAHGTRDAAEATIRRAISVDPSDGEEGPNDRMRAYAVLAEVLRGKGDTKQAALYEGAVRAIRMSEQADEFHGVGLYTRAFAQYRAALEQFSDAYCIQSRLAVQLNKQGRRSEALEHYRRAYELMPSSFGRVESHCFGCENVFQGSDQQSIAERVFTDIIRRTPNNAQAHYLLAYLREQQGRYAEAVQPLRAAVSLDDQYLNAWKRLQEIADKTYIDAGERDIARLKLLELDPLRRHGWHELSEVGALAELWNGAARANALSRQAAPPATGVYPLAATVRARDSRLKSLPAEAREQLEEMEKSSRPADVFSMHVVPLPAVLLGEHTLVEQTQKLMGLKSRYGFPVE